MANKNVFLYFERITSVNPARGRQGQTTPEALAGAGWPGIPWWKWAPNS